MARVRSTEQSGVSGETTRGKRRETRSACTGVFRSLYAPPTDMSIKAVRKHCDMRIRGVGWRECGARSNPGCQEKPPEAKDVKHGTIHGHHEQLK